MPNYELWNHSVEIEIPNDVFPSSEKLKEIDGIFNHPEHGYYEGTYEKKKLHYRKYVPKDNQPPKAIVLWLHGIHGQGGYGMRKKNGRYTNCALRARVLQDCGYALYVPDMLGHGFSEGNRFYVPKYQVNRDDIVAFCQQIIGTEYNDAAIPLFLMGDSYGGCIILHTARYFQDHPDQAPSNLKGIVLNCPAIIGDLPPKPVIWFLRYALAPFIPRSTPFFMPHPISSERIWKDEEVRKYHSDPKESHGLSMDGKKFCLGTAVQLLVALETVRKEVIPGLTICPIHVTHGTEDYGVPIAGSELLMKHCATAGDTSSTTKLNRVEGGYHDLFSGDDAKDLMNEQIDWMEERIIAQKQE